MNIIERITTKKIETGSPSIIKVGSFNADDKSNFETVMNKDRDIQNTGLDGALPPIAPSSDTQDI